MNARDAIKLNLDQATMICNMYLGDLTDKELLVRPVPGCNHIAWQLGHTIVAEHGLVESAYPGTMPKLPDGFAERYTKDTAKLDSASAFHSKAQYLELMQSQRAGTIAQLNKLTDADLDKPGPEKHKDYIKNIGDLFSLQGTHWMMHAGQWAVVRRKLGKKPMF